MSIEFKIKDFFYPFSVIKLKRFLDKSQWFDGERLQQYQVNRLNQILKHAREQTPFYKTGYPDRIKELKELEQFPILTKKMLRQHQKSLIAKNHLRFKPTLHQTSGTTGKPITFYLDKSANILEFCYYWRYWGWAGYGLGAPFADLGLHYFLIHDIKAVSHFNPLTRKLSLNAAQISRKRIHEYAGAIKRRKIRFLKGPPSGLFVMADLLEREGILDLRMQALFTTGETLHPHQRQKMEKVFSCRVQDSYGHMERTVGVCQCPEGSYHINPEYGIFEVKREEELCSPEMEVGRIIGTSLHNFAMPLIRYDTGDLVEISRTKTTCACKRTLPLCHGVIGREQDLILTGDNRYISNAFIVFNFVKGVSWFQIVQHERDRFVIRVVCDNDFIQEERKKVIQALDRLAGPAKITFEEITMEEARPREPHKYRSVVSHVEPKK